MKILLLGKNGQVGWELERTLALLGEVMPLGRNELDLTNVKEIRRTVRGTKPDLIINAAAYTAVDKAEEEQELAMAINGVAPGILAEEAKRLNIGIIHYSTDYVFDGTKNTPYTEEDLPKPINVYGKTKLAGEKAIQVSGTPYFIFRTSWVYGLRGKNFLLTILRLAREREELRIVDDQIGSPTWSRMIAEATAQVLAQGFTDRSEFMKLHSGVYHLSCSGSVNWYGFVRSILDLDPNRADQVCLKIYPIPSKDFPSQARRPVNSILKTSKIKKVFGIEMLSWHKALNLALREV